MSIRKKGTCSSAIVVSSAVYVCNNCGYTEMAKNPDKKNKKCPKCKSEMNIVSSNS